MGASNDDGSAGEIKAGAWQEQRRAVAREFPGPRSSAALVALRVTMERAAYAEVVAHAKESLDAEICGVLAGELCEDGEGRFVHVKAAVRGTAARGGSAHVTYTQETWNAIHAEMERRYPKLAIVGWYHSHPGFGVEFSDMDRFIQRHFFAMAEQIGLLTDPLGGDVALLVNTAGGQVTVDRFWVDGREQRARVPSASAVATGAGATGGPATAGDRSIESLETRVSQLIKTVDDLQRTLHRFLLLAGSVFATAILLLSSYQIYRSWSAPYRPPENLQDVEMPLSINGKVCLVSLRVLSWQVPPELLPTPPPCVTPESDTAAPTPSSAEAGDGR